MTTVIVFGSRSVSSLPPAAIESLDKIMELGFTIIVGDAPGVDILTQIRCKAAKYKEVKVYYALFRGNGRPRVYLKYPIFGVRGNYTDRDKQMCWIADYGLAIWDGHSRGSLRNIEHLKTLKIPTKIILTND
ncbi:hypothetical protein PN499_22185 [Kamptonema animale CS-326]|jgi:hypothetical protein|uniref:hypothetical protein n=1 Tax=Kamptonema animale TaxID=92934 RepID=UPI00232C7BC3|nr:hypothetical protein [Kamptonema animale]MDB9513913.1 hypothetical protein [Kamptonema animale CS-326]